MDFIKQLQGALTDPEYRQGWKAIIAMAFKDEYFSAYAGGYAPPEEPHSMDFIHVFANKAADRFLDMFCSGTAPDVKQPAIQTEINATEAVYGFAAWLTSSRKRIVMSSRHNAAPALEAVVEFCNTNKLPPLADGWEQKVQFPNLMKTLQEKRTEMGQRLFTKQGELPIEDDEDQTEVSGGVPDLKIAGINDAGCSAMPPALEIPAATTGGNDAPPVADSVLASLEGAANFTIPPVGGNGTTVLDDMPF